MSDQDQLNPLQEPTPEPGLFDDYIDKRQEEAGLGQRFVNYLIDNIVMYFGLTYLTGALVGAILGLLFPDYISRIFNDRDDTGLAVLGYAVVLFNYLFYYTFCEKVFKGYTLGKLVTGTRAVREDGAELTFKDAILRTLSRMIPFEAFSALGGRPWHDSLTKTSVIKSR